MIAWDELLADATAGEPLSGLKGSRKTIRKLSRQLGHEGFKVGRTTVARRLRLGRDALRVNRKRVSRRHDPPRDQPMRYLARQRRQFLPARWPVSSGEGQKKELSGAFKPPGRPWRTQPLEGLETAFPSQATGTALPYGIDDLARNAGEGVIGTSHATPAFAVAASRAWGVTLGRRAYAGGPELLLEADGGGANGHRGWLWQAGLQALAEEVALQITVTHYPAGASQWNRIEQRRFRLSSSNWAGQPLISYETAVKFIRTTRSDKGFHCRARRDPTVYETGVKLTLAEKACINLQPQRLLPKYNYTTKPRTPTCQK